MSIFIMFPKTNCKFVHKLSTNSVIGCPVALPICHGTCQEIQLWILCLDVLLYSDPCSSHLPINNLESGGREGQNTLIIILHI